KYFEQVMQVLGSRKEDEALRLWLTGVFFTNYAWDARGAGGARTVAPDAARSFAERLHKAEEALEKAWALDAENPYVAEEMLVVARGLGYDRDQMNTWFRRAMEADGDCYDACARKFEYLLPEWRGDFNQARTFVEYCAHTANDTAGLPELISVLYAKFSAQPG